MNREILFKGKVKAGYKNMAEGEWIEGGLFYSDDENGIFCQISTSYLSSDKDEPLMVVAYAVDPETVCQYINYEDAGKNKVFENDIVSCVGRKRKGVIRYDKGCYVIDWGENTDLRRDVDFWFTKRTMHVIGNVFDNANLLKE